MDRPIDATDETTVGVFDRRRAAEACVQALEERGFDGSLVGFAGPGRPALAPSGPVSGGVLDGLLGGIVPGIGPLVAGGVLAGVVAKAPTTRTTGGLGEALEAAGLAPELAQFYTAQVRAGRYLVAVRGNRRAEAARSVMLCGGQVEGAVSNAVSRATGTQPQPPELVEGVFGSDAMAKEVAEQLRAAFPGSIVTVDDGQAPHRVRVRPRH